MKEYWEQRRTQKAERPRESRPPEGEEA
jgi:hypothetical protein